MMYFVPPQVRMTAYKGLVANREIKCNNAIGVRRARQLIIQPEISIVTIKKMYSYLSRAKTYYQPGDLSKCGTVSFMLWGGTPALIWTRKILKAYK